MTLHNINNLGIMTTEIHIHRSRSISIADMRLTSIPVKYSSEITYDFYCDYNRLYLNNSPRIVAESYDCYDNDLSSLDGISLLIGVEIGYASRSLSLD